MERKIKEIIEGAAISFEERLTLLASAIREKCHSPIEEMLAVAMLAQARTDFDFLNAQFYMDEHILPYDGTPPQDGVLVFSQVKIRKYRVDFLLLHKDGEHIKRVVVECDGHDFHERTKEQAARDRSRDRDMAGMGMTVLRFTGSEIWKDANACAMDVFGHLIGLP